MQSVPITTDVVSSNPVQVASSKSKDFMARVQNNVSEWNDTQTAVSVN
jgi:hypothetical protein